MEDEYIRLDENGFPLPRASETSKIAPPFTPKVTPPSYLQLKMKTASGRSIKIALLIIAILSAILFVSMIGLLAQKYMS